MAIAPDRIVPAPFGLVAGRYAIDSVLGSGGNSVVYRATDRVLERPVALKVMPGREGASAHAPFDHEEAQLAASLDHPAVVRTLDAGHIEAPGGYRARFLVLELVDGPDLRHMLRRGALPTRTAVGVCAVVAGALAYVHRRGIVHNDVKPANVLVPAADPERVRLADFGIAFRADRSEPDQIGSTLGTAAYLSPERVLGEAVGSASDVYALGLVLLECLTGRIVFPGSPTASAVARLDREPEIPETVPVAIAEVLRGMTASLPQERPTAEAAARRLRESVGAAGGRHAA